jgi:hypothetical protein
MNDPCRICIEGSYDTTIRSLHKLSVGSFQVLAAELQRYAATMTNGTAAAMRAGYLAQTAASISGMLDTDAVEQFYFYYVTRGAYAELGKARYQQGYATTAPAIGLCKAQAETFDFTCPAATEVTPDEAEAALLRHADASFSSVNTAGSALPFWSDNNSTNVRLFGGSSPIGGSGVDMSGNILSMAAYLNVTHYGKEGWSPMYGTNGFADPTSPMFAEAVERNPIFRCVPLLLGRRSPFSFFLEHDDTLLAPASHHCLSSFCCFRTPPQLVLG